MSVKENPDRKKKKKITIPKGGTQNYNVSGLLINFQIMILDRLLTQKMEIYRILTIIL